MTPPPSPSDRRRAIKALSLDRAEPLLVDLGLTQLPPDRIRACFREMARSIVDNASPAPEDHIAERVESALGTAFAKAFDLVLFAIDLCNDQRFNIWIFRLIEWSRAPSIWAELTEGAPSLARFREPCRAALYDATIGSKVDLIAGAPFSAWDAWLYAASQFNDDDNDPVLDLDLIAQRMRVADFWRRVHAEAPIERERFLANAKRMIAASGRSYDLAPLPLDPRAD